MELAERPMARDESEGLEADLQKGREGMAPGARLGPYENVAALGAGGMARFTVAAVCARVGDKQCVFDWLEKSFDGRDDLRTMLPGPVAIPAAWSCGPLLIHFSLKRSR